MISSLFHPAFILVAGGLLLPLFRGIWRSLWALSIPLLTLAAVWLIDNESFPSIQFLDYELQLLVVDKLSRLFATVFSIMAFAGILFCYRQARTVELSAAMLYAGSAIGVVFAGDLLTLFIFWELMALGSTFILWSAGTLSSWQASRRYILIHLLGGVILMTGITAYAHDTGSIVFTAMHADRLSTWLILIGFLVNVGAPPISAWIADAYPEASFSGMVFLSAFTTKAAVYVLLRGYPGTELLIYLGLFMIFYGIIYALLENDMRRILAYSIVNQVGFMVCGIGIGSDMALNGAASHAFTHIIYKALLLMSAGSVLYMTGKRKCTDLGGLFQSMPLTALCGIIGALSISSFPLTSGFISKSMITQATVDNHLLVTWLLLQAASAGVFLHAGIKFPWFVFFQKDSGLRPSDPPINMRLAMLLFSFLCIFLGVAPAYLYQLLPYPVEYVPYTAVHILTQLQLLLFSGLAFFVLLPLMQRTETISLDFDWSYRRFLPQLFRLIEVFWLRIVRVTVSICMEIGQILLGGLAFIYQSPLISRSAARISLAVIWVVLFLAGYLMFYLFEN